jgi:CRP/FNR family transcriptional regulator, cyclic AMP receptor protein
MAQSVRAGGQKGIFGMDMASDPRERFEIPVRGWFAECSASLRHEILALARPKSLPADWVLFRTGDAGGDLFGIVEGVVCVQCRFAHPDAVLTHMLWPGEWFGSLQSLVARRRRYTLTTRTDVRLVRIPGRELQALFNRYPEGFAHLGLNAGYGLDLAMQGAADLLIRDATSRCAAVLLRLAGRRWASGADDSRPVDIPASQAELAMLCNLSRSYFSRVMRELSRRGLVIGNYKSLTLTDPVKLRLFAERD